MEPIQCCHQPYDPVWSYRISHDERKLEELAVLKDGKPYWAFRANEKKDGGDVRGAMEAFFDLLSGISRELPVNEVMDLLSMVSEATYDLTGIEVRDPSPGPSSTSSSTI
jgi:gentisate 1,2-dioxygenase